MEAATSDVRHWSLSAKKERGGGAGRTSQNFLGLNEEPRKKGSISAPSCRKSCRSEGRDQVVSTMMQKDNRPLPSRVFFEEEAVIANAP